MKYRRRQNGLNVVFTTYLGLHHWMNKCIYCNCIYRGPDLAKKIFFANKALFTWRRQLLYKLVFISQTLCLEQKPPSPALVEKNIIQIIARITVSPCDGSCTITAAMNSLLHWSDDPSIDWLIDWLTDWLIDWLTEWLTDRLIDWLIDLDELVNRSVPLQTEFHVFFILHIYIVLSSQVVTEIFAKDKLVSFYECRRRVQKEGYKIITKISAQKREMNAQGL